MVLGEILVRFWRAFGEILASFLTFLDKFHYKCLYSNDEWRFLDHVAFYWAQIRCWKSFYQVSLWFN